MLTGNSENYKKLKKKYDEYVELYTFFNSNSTEGVTTFAEFYWRFTYYVQYSDPTNVATEGI